MYTTVNANSNPYLKLTYDIYEDIWIETRIGTKQKKCRSSAENAKQLKRTFFNQIQFTVTGLHSSQLLIGFQSMEMVKFDVNFILKSHKKLWLNEISGPRKYC